MPPRSFETAVPRSRRIDGPGLFHHVVVRGIERRLIFVDDEDRSDLLQRLSVILPALAVPCLAWALMDNHVHLVVRTSDAPLARAMARVLTGYALRFNRRHGRVGHLFQNRYYSRPLCDQADLTAVVAYVHRNPLAAGIVDSVRALETHPWTGHAALMGNSDAWPFHALPITLELFGPSIAEARDSLRHWLSRAEDQPGYRDEQQPQSGSAATRVRDRAVPANPDGLIEIVCRRLGIDRKHLADGRRNAPVATGRAVIAYVAARRGWSVPRLAPMLGVSAAALYQALSRGDKALRELPELEDLE